MSGELPEGWIQLSLVEICEGGLFADGDWIESKDQDPHGLIRLLQLSDIGDGFFLDKTRRFINKQTADRLRVTYLQKGDILLARMPDPLGRCCLFPIDEKSITAVDVCIIRPPQSVNREWLAYNLNSPRTRSLISAQGTGTTRTRISRQNLGNILLSVPPLPEQRRIAEILSSVDEAIAATRAVIEQTRKVKQAVLERLLTKGIGHTRFKQTEIGEIPEGWKTGTVGEFFTLQRGFDITEKHASEGKYPVVSSSGISYYHSTSMILGPAVITGRKGKLGQVHFIDGPCWPHDTTLWVKDFKGREPKFIYWFLRSLNLEKFDAATAVPTLNRNVVHALKCAFPPNSEQLLIAHHLDSIEETERSQTRNLASYEHMKSALMSDLLTGRKRVSDPVTLAAE